MSLTGYTVDASRRLIHKVNAALGASGAVVFYYCHDDHHDCKNNHKNLIISHRHHLLFHRGIEALSPLSGEAINRIPLTGQAQLYIIIY